MLQSGIGNVKAQGSEQANTHDFSKNQVSTLLKRTLIQRSENINSSNPTKSYQVAIGASLEYPPGKVTSWNCGHVSRQLRCGISREHPSTVTLSKGWIPLQVQTVPRKVLLSKQIECYARLSKCEIQLLQRGVP